MRPAIKLLEELKNSIRSIPVAANSAQRSLALAQIEGLKSMLAREDTEYCSSHEKYRFKLAGGGELEFYHDDEEDVVVCHAYGTKSDGLVIKPKAANSCTLDNPCRKSKKVSGRVVPELQDAICALWGDPNWTAERIGDLLGLPAQDVQDVMEGLHDA